MFGVALRVSAGSKERNEGGLAAPIIVSVDANLSVCNDEPPGFSNVGFKDCCTLGGGAIDESLTEYDYTHFADGTGAGDTSPPAFPGAAWTAYTQNVSDRAVDWDQFGNENGPLDQPPGAGPYIGADPWNDGKNFTVIDGDGGASWKRIVITVKNAAGQDSAEFFYQDDCF